MKNSVLVLVLTICTFSLNAQIVNECDSAYLKDKLLLMNLKKYYRRDVGSYLKDIGCNYSNYNFVQSKPFSLAWCRVVYSNDLWVDIYVKKFRFMKKELDEAETEAVWKMEDFYKETTSKIRILYRGKVVNQYPKRPIMPSY